MLVSHRKKFIYTKTVKTAGTSVELYFEPWCLPAGEWELTSGREETVSSAGIIGFRGWGAQDKTWFNHMSAERIREQLGQACWDEYFKFCVVRDPFEKAVSMYHFLEKRHTPPGMVRPGHVTERFRQWILQDGPPLDRDKYTISGKICVDYIIRYENLQEGIQKVCGTLKIPFEPEHIPQLKAGSRPDDISLGDYYDNTTTGIVSRYYSFEIREFGYAPP